MGICAQISIPLVFTTVPITGQTFGVLLLGFLLGPGYGTAAVGAYLVEGALGLPLFAGGSGGIGHLLGPTGGYVLGFLPATWITGTLAQWGWDRHLLGSLAAAAGGLAVIFACGLLATQMFPVTMLLLPLFIMLIKLKVYDSYLGLIIAYSATALPFTIWQMKGYYDTIPYSLENRITPSDSVPGNYRPVLLYGRLV